MCDAQELCKVSLASCAFECQDARHEDHLSKRYHGLLVGFRAVGFGFRVYIHGKGERERETERKREKERERER